MSPRHPSLKKQTIPAQVSCNLIIMIILFIEWKLMINVILNLAYIHSSAPNQKFQKIIIIFSDYPLEKKLWILISHTALRYHTWSSCNEFRLPIESSRVKLLRLTKTIFEWKYKTTSKFFYLMYPLSGKLILVFHPDCLTISKQRFLYP